MARSTPAATLYLLLPPRTAVQRALPAKPSMTANAAGADLSSLPLGFAWTLRHRLQRVDHAPLASLAPLVAQAARVVLLLAASDVTLFRMAVPPLPAARLHAALPALVEDRVIGDPEACAIAAGAELDGQRTIAVTDRAWLQQWLAVLRSLGARRIAALPLQLCLPLPAGQVSAALIDLSGTLELVLRTSPEEGLGLPVDTAATAATAEAGSPQALIDAVMSLLATFTGGRPVQMAMTPSHAALFQAWLAQHPASGITLVEDSWATWVEGASQVSVDLATGVAQRTAEGPDWRRWRWPLRLALACVLLNVIALNADWWRRRDEAQSVENAMWATYRRAFPNDPPPAQPLPQMRQKVAAMRQAAGEFAAGDFLTLAAALGEAWSEAGNDKRAIAGLDYREATLTVRLKPGAQASIDAMGPALAARRLTVTPSAGDPALWQVRSAP